MYKIIGIEGLVRLNTKEIAYDDSKLLNRLSIPHNPLIAGDDNDIAYFTSRTFLELLELAKSKFDSVNWDEKVKKEYKERAEKQYDEIKRFAKSKKLIVISKT